MTTTVNPPTNNPLGKRLRYPIARNLIIFFGVLFVFLVVYKRLSPTEAHMKEKVAYDIAVQWISSHLKAPSTAHFQPIEEVQFSTGGIIGYRDSINVHLYVDAQNSFGAMMRESYLCRTSLRPGGIYCVTE